MLAFAFEASVETGPALEREFRREKGKGFFKPRSRLQVQLIAERLPIIQAPGGRDFSRRRSQRQPLDPGARFRHAPDEFNRVNWRNAVIAAEMSRARGQADADLRRIAAFDRARLSGQVAQIALKIAFSVNVVERALCERSDQTRKIESDAAAARRRAAQTFKVGFLPLIENEPQVEPVKLQTVQDDFAA